MTTKDLVYEGEKVIVRGIGSGVFYGTLVWCKGQHVRMENCRRIWEWKGAATTTELAVNGVKFPDQSKITLPVKSMEILDAVEILLCSEKAIRNLDSVNEWKA